MSIVMLFASVPVPSMFVRKLYAPCSVLTKPAYQPMPEPEPVFHKVYSDLHLLESSIVLSSS
ncbi:hypothetical protein UM89_08080 [Bacillus subtilis]|nr:hypothetical protein UM89_08080 [Bacillus subtilis]